MILGVLCSLCPDIGGLWFQFEPDAPPFCCADGSDDPGHCSGRDGHHRSGSPDGRTLPNKPRRLVPGYGRPAFVIDASIAEYLKVLRFVPVGSVRVIEGIQHADSFDRLL
jgi:hypothetical protein